MRHFFSLLFLFPLLLCADVSELCRDLEVVRWVNCEINDQLPFIYNNTMMGGYFNMPSARMNETGMVAFGAASVPPYGQLNFNFQPFSHIELSGNIRVFNGILDSNFGNQGFGDDTDRTANVKFALLKPSQNFPFLPSIALGWEDFYGSRRFNAFYAVITKEWVEANLEFTLGWGKDRIKGFFGGVAWSPLRKYSIPLLSDMTFMAEYDATDYENHKDEHPKARDVKTHFNGGVAITMLDTIQVKLGSLRGNKLQGSLSLNYNFGQSCGLFPKVCDPEIYTHPIDIEPLCGLRSETELASELAFGLCEQGFTLASLYLDCDSHCRTLWMRVINTRYRLESVVRDRLQHLLAALVPCDIEAVTVVLEADGLPSQQYCYRTCDLRAYREGEMGTCELETLSPREEASETPSLYDAIRLFHNSKEIVIFTVRPRVITFFGSVNGKLKASVGLVAGPEGYLFDEVYYKVQFAYNAYSSLSDVGDMDRLNPSQLPNVRSDAIRYFQSQSFSVEQAYLQKSFNLGCGFFGRFAAGYFEPAYAGLASEFLLYPVNANWAIGVSGAGVLKRNYHGLGFTTKIRKFDGFTPEYIHFIGYQYFLDLYYNIERWDLNFKISAGKFLARDSGARFEFTRTYPSGLQFSIWYTLTNGHDRVNNHPYQDKGIAFTIPFDFFLRQSSRTYIGYAMSAWLRDTGASAATGKPLFRTLYHERLNY